jgi:host factor-I protein
MADFDTGLPSVRFIQKLIKDKSTTELKTLSNEIFTGKILWQDSLCVCLQESNDHQRIIWKQALMYLTEKK